MERIDTLTKAVGRKISEGSKNSGFKTEDEERVFNSKLLNLELRLIRYYIDNRIDRNISRLYNLSRFIAKLYQINRLGCNADKKIDRIERLMGFYEIKI